MVLSCRTAEDSLRPLYQPRANAKVSIGMLFVCGEVGLAANLFVFFCFSHLGEPNLLKFSPCPLNLRGEDSPPEFRSLVAHDCGYPLSRFTCRATRVAADFLDFIAFCRCSTSVALHPLKFWCRTPPVPGGVAPKFGSEKVSRYAGVSQLQLRVSRYTVQLSLGGGPQKTL